MTELSDKKSENIPLVTIITPTYNSNKEYLFEAVTSVLQQTYPKIEYIITDDGSQYFPEEELREFLKENAGDNIVSWSILKHKTNVGTVKNVNGAIQIAQGDYIFGVAHDDVFYDPCVIEKMVSEFLLTSASILTSMRECYDSNNDQPKIILPILRHRNKIRHLSSSALYSDLLKGNYIAGAGTAYSRSFFQKYGLIDESYILVEDAPIILMAASQGLRIHLWEGISLKYRLGGVSSQNVNQLYAKDHLLLASRYFKQEHGINKINAMIGLGKSYWTYWKISTNMRYDKLQTCDHNFYTKSELVIKYLLRCNLIVINEISNVYRELFWK